MIYEAIIHEQTRDYIYPINSYQLAIRIKAKKGDMKECILHYYNMQKTTISNSSKVSMTCYARDKRFDYYEVLIDTGERTKYIKYFFEINDGTNIVYFNYYGISLTIQEEGNFQYLVSNENDYMETPDWVGKSIFYQIFPERYYDGNEDNNPDDVVEWGSSPTRENFMGGDLEGIYKKIDYLKTLGVNAVYLNPIFEAPSNHKYDTVDYFKIDKHFGDIDDLKKLVEVLHENDIKLILDGVFNHCGYYLKQFQDVISNGEKSKYRDWFYIDQLPVDTDKVNYECVGYYKWMPKLNFSNEEVREYIKEIGRYWIKEANIDGWRLDVADEIDSTFWNEFRREVRSVKKECFILGETWIENKSMLRGDQMDSVMNYLFFYAVTEYFAKNTIDTYEFDSRINQFLGVYSRRVHYSLFNLIGSHDTTRFLTSCNKNVNKLKLAAAFQLLFIGVPCIYYGDEIGMEGPNDPGCRGAMNWSFTEREKSLLEYYKSLINIRKKYRALVEGKFKSIYCSNENSVYAFVREITGERVYVILNNEDKTNEITIPLLEKYDKNRVIVDIITDDEFHISSLQDEKYYNCDIYPYESCANIDVEAYGVRILIVNE